MNTNHADHLADNPAPECPKCGGQLVADILPCAFCGAIKIEKPFDESEPREVDGVIIRGPDA